MMLDGLFKITRDFDMQTQPHLLLLQKTMVMVEGVATSLDPDINMWDTAAPFIREWIRTELGPEAYVADRLITDLRTLARLPDLVRRIEAHYPAPGGAPPAPPLKEIEVVRIGGGWRYVAVALLSASGWRSPRLGRCCTDGDLAGRTVAICRGCPRAARGSALVLLLVLLAATLTALTVPQPAPVSGDSAKRGDDQADVVLYESIVDGVRHGGNYYAVAADQLRAGDYPMKPFVTFRLPTLAVVQAMMPGWAVIGCLYALAAARDARLVRCGCAARSRAPPPLVLAMVLLAGGMGAFVQPELAAFHEVWAGLLIALSLALRRDDRWVAAAGIGALAMLIRETARLYVAIMFVLALARRQPQGSGRLGGRRRVAGGRGRRARSCRSARRPPARPGLAGLGGDAGVRFLRRGDDAVNRAPRSRRCGWRRC